MRFLDGGSPCCYCFRHALTVDGARFAEALAAEGLPCELGYPGPIPLYLYPMIREKKTFGGSGRPFNSPAARKRWDYEPGLCPVAETACGETIVLSWNEGLRSERVDLIARAIRKVTGGFKR